MKKLLKSISSLYRARKELSEAQQKNKNLQATMSTGIRYKMFRPILAECHLSLSPVPEKLDDEHIVYKIIDGYNKLYFNRPDAMWAIICDQLKLEIHQALIDRNIDAIRDIFNNPASGNLFYGFEHYGTEIENIRNSINNNTDQGLASYLSDQLLRLAETLGVRRLENPEHYPHSGIPTFPSIDELFKEIARALPFGFDIPNPYPDLAGLKTPYGIATHRTLMAIYVACRINELVRTDRRDTSPNSSKCVLEIGGGLGWLAYFARKFGLGRYDIVDIPMTAIAASHFLSVTLGEEQVSVLGEGQEKPVRILAPSQFPENGKYDLIVNVDSLTEMGQETALDYWKKIKKCSRRFLSINHEVNPFTVRQLALDDPDLISYSRFPYWMRQGYVEEIFEFKEIG